MDQSDQLAKRVIDSLNDGINHNHLIKVSPTGATLTNKVTYNADNLVSAHNAEFLLDPRFQQAYQAGMATATGWLPAGMHIEWRVQICCWAAAHASKLAGDFVECGVNTGIYTTAILNYLAPEALAAKQIWLFDTFHGIPAAGLGAESEAASQPINNLYYARDIYEDVKAHFAPYDNVHLVRGAVPGTLTSVDIGPVAYLSIDMNVPEPEVAALAYFWDKLVPGAVVVLDDYGFVACHRQKTAIDDLMRTYGIEVWTLPTGQGLILRP